MSRVTDEEFAELARTRPDRIDVPTLYAEAKRARESEQGLLNALQALADRMSILAAHARRPAINELELIRAVEVIKKAKGE